MGRSEVKDDAFGELVALAGRRGLRAGHLAGLSSTHHEAWWEHGHAGEVESVRGDCGRDGGVVHVGHVPVALRSRVGVGGAAESIALLAATTAAEPLLIGRPTAG